MGDLHLPDGGVKPDTPVALLIHGGGWSGMGRADVVATRRGCDIIRGMAHPAVFYDADGAILCGGTIAGRADDGV